MKTESTDQIKELNSLIKKVKASMNIIQVSEKVQYNAIRTEIYENAKIDAINSTNDLIDTLTEMLSIAYNIGSCNGAHGLFTTFKVVEYDMRYDNNDNL